jgi:hypothetical protein
MAETALHKFDFIKNMIPKIDIIELDRRIKLTIPCVEKDNKVIRIKNYGDPIKQSFSWSHSEDKEIGHISYDGLSERDRPAEYPGSWYMKQVADKVGEFLTLHNFGYYGFYKPSIEEVLAQLPAELFDEEKLAGRKLYFTNKMISADINVSMLNQENHIAKTTVYIQTK